MINSSVSPAEQADRLAISELVDAYAHCADRRDAEGQKRLFTEDTHFAVYMDGQGSERTLELDGREAPTLAFEGAIALAELGSPVASRRGAFALPSAQCREEFTASSA